MIAYLEGLANLSVFFCNLYVTYLVIFTIKQSKYEKARQNQSNSDEGSN